MNSFYEHHRDSIHWHYRCFDRILLNGLIQPFQQPERVVGFFNTYRQLYPVTRYTLTNIADQFQHWVKERAAKRNIPIVEAPKGRRDDFVDPYFEQAKPDAVVVILKGREPARIMIAIGDKIANRWHLQIAKPTREFTRLCRGGRKSLTYPEVGSLGPWTGLQTVSHQAHERSPANGVATRSKATRLQMDVLPESGKD